MLKHTKLLPAVGAAALLATLVGAPPASAAGAGGPGGSGNATTASKKAPSAACKELTTDGGFEAPKVKGADWMLFDEDDVPGWRTDDPQGQIEIWKSGMDGVPARFGSQFAELNATGSGNSIYQDIKTKPNSKIYWSFWIRARDTSDAKDVDATQIHFGRTPKSDNGNVNGVGSTFAYMNTATDVSWRRLSGWYQTGSNQTMTRVTLTAVESASTDEGYGNLVDGLTIVDNKKCI